MNTAITSSFALLIPLSAISLLLGASTENVGYFLLFASIALLLLSCYKQLLLKALIALVLVGVAIAILKGHVVPFLYYPVVASLAVASCFIFSYWSSSSLIEKIARRFEPGLPIEALPYCRKVNHVWSIFILTNALIAIYLATTDRLQAWALYNGAISYALTFLLFSFELLVRRKVKKRIRLQKEALQFQTGQHA